MSGGPSLNLLQFNTYDEYLDSFVLTSDTRYYRSAGICRQLVTLGYRSQEAILTRSQFERQRQEACESLYRASSRSMLFSNGMTTTDPVLKELAMREQPNVQQSISTIIFLKMTAKNGTDISGFIDYEESLRMARRRAENYTDWHRVFRDEVVLKPNRTNMSYMDWRTSVIEYNSTDNYEVLHDAKDGLMFMHRGDHKIICPNLKNKSRARNCTSKFVQSNVYGYVILYDHVVLKKI